MERRLGRGLGSLLSGAAAEAQAGSGGPSAEIPLDSVQPNRHQPRTVFDPAALEELAASIRTHGVLQPVVVRPHGGGHELIAGERRVRAARIAGLKTIPAIVRADVTDQQMLEFALVENLQRQDLDPIERAKGYRRMGEELSLTQEQVADKVGLKRATVANHVRLLELPEVAQAALQSGLLSMGHARALLGLPNEDGIADFVSRIVRQGLSVREVEAQVRAQAKPAAPAKEGVIPAPRGTPWVTELEARMAESLGAKVAVRNQPGYRGQIVIEYYGREDLDRLCARLAPRPEV